MSAGRESTSGLTREGEEITVPKVSLAEPAQQGADAKLGWEIY